MANNNWRGVTDQLVQEMIDLYNSGCAIQKVADYFSLSRSTVDYWFRKKYVELRPNRKWFCNFDFFKDIKTEKQAYWTGVFAGDGNISKNHEISIGLKTSDEDHLIKFREDIDGDFPIKHTFSKSKSSPGKLFPQSEAVIGSIEMERDLNRLGYFVSTKTHTHRWPTADKIPEELWPHFLRGKFDADGGFVIDRDKHQMSWGIASNYEFCKEAKLWLIRKCGVGDVEIIPKPGAWKLRYTGCNQTSKLFHLMYDNATIWMPRKRDKVESFVLEIDERNDKFRLAIEQVKPLRELGYSYEKIGQTLGIGTVTAWNEVNGLR